MRTTARLQHMHRQTRISVINHHITTDEKNRHWNGKVVTLTKFLLLAALEIVILTTSCASNQDNFVKRTFPFQWKSMAPDIGCFKITMASYQRRNSHYKHNVYIYPPCAEQHKYDLGSYLKYIYICGFITHPLTPGNCVQTAHATSTDSLHSPYLNDLGIPLRFTRSTIGCHQLAHLSNGCAHSSKQLPKLVPYPVVLWNFQ